MEQKKQFLKHQPSHQVELRTVKNYDVSKQRGVKLACHHSLKNIRIAK